MMMMYCTVIRLFIILNYCLYSTSIHNTQLHVGLGSGHVNVTFSLFVFKNDKKIRIKRKKIFFLKACVFNKCGKIGKKRKCPALQACGLLLGDLFCSAVIKQVSLSDHDIEI